MKPRLLALIMLQEATWIRWKQAGEALYTSTENLTRAVDAFDRASRAEDRAFSAWMIEFEAELEAQQVNEMEVTVH